MSRDELVFYRAKPNVTFKIDGLSDEDYIYFDFDDGGCSCGQCDTRDSTKSVTIKELYEFLKDKEGFIDEESKKIVKQAKKDLTQKDYEFRKLKEEFERYKNAVKLIQE